MTKRKRLIIIGIALVAILSALIVIFTKNDEPKVMIKGVATNFAEFGVLNFQEPVGDNIFLDPYLIYGHEGRPSLSVKLVMDAESICATDTGSTPCMAMSVTLDIPFNNKSATVEGIQTEEGVILVRKLRIVDPLDESLIAPQSGLVYIPWAEAREHIRSCNVNMISQAHDLNVTLVLKDGQTVTSVEPIIDEVMGVAALAREDCGIVPTATE